MRTPISAILVLGSMAALAACGGPTPPGPPASPDPAPATDPSPATDPAPADPAPEPASAPAAWSDDLSKAEKGAYMKAHVLPKMKEVFQSMGGDRYTGFNCATCHGTDWKDHPKDALPKLTMKDGKFDVPEAQQPVVEFMMTKVVPEMATLFGKEPYDPKTNEGFGCAGCHQVQM